MFNVLRIHPSPLTYALLFQHLLYKVLVTGLDVSVKYIPHDRLTACIKHGKHTKKKSLCTI